MEITEKNKSAQCKFSDLESILYFRPTGSLDTIYLPPAAAAQPMQAAAQKFIDVDQSKRESRDIL